MAQYALPIHDYMLHTHNYSIYSWGTPPLVPALIVLYGLLMVNECICANYCTFVSSKLQKESATSTKRKSWMFKCTRNWCCTLHYPCQYLLNVSSGRCPGGAQQVHNTGAGGCVVWGKIHIHLSTEYELFSVTRWWKRH